MHLTSRTEAVVRVYRRLDLHLRTFQSFAGLRCTPGCGECCLSDSVEATILELFPAARRVEQEGDLERTLEILRFKAASDRCLFYSPEERELPNGADRSSGHCGMYDCRPLMCRLFGFAACLDREGRRQLVTCRKVRERMPEETRKAREGVSAGSIPAPVMSNYSMEIFSIDPSLGVRLYPINEALAQALEIRGFDSRRRKKAS